MGLCLFDIELEIGPVSKLQKYLQMMAQEHMGYRVDSGVLGLSLMAWCLMESFKRR